MTDVLHPRKKTPLDTTPVRLEWSQWDSRESAYIDHKIEVPLGVLQAAGFVRESALAQPDDGGAELQHLREAAELLRRCENHDSTGNRFFDLQRIHQDMCAWWKRDQARTPSPPKAEPAPEPKPEAVSHERAREAVRNLQMNLGGPTIGTDRLFRYIDQQERLEPTPQELADERALQDHLSAQRDETGAETLGRGGAGEGWAANEVHCAHRSQAHRAHPHLHNPADPDRR